MQARPGSRVQKVVVQRTRSHARGVEVVDVLLSTGRGVEGDFYSRAIVNELLLERLLAGRVVGLIDRRPRLGIERIVKDNGRQDACLVGIGDTERLAASSVVSRGDGGPVTGDRDLRRLSSLPIADDPQHQAAHGRDRIDNRLRDSAASVEVNLRQRD